MPPESLKLHESLLLLVDLTEGPLATVRSVAPRELRMAVECLSEGATLLQLPVLQLRAPLPDAAAAPVVNAGSVVRHVTNDAWRTPEAVQAVQSSGRKQLLIAGIATEVGVALTAMSAARAGYQCTVILDACGTVSARAELCAIQRLTLAGIGLQSWSGCLAELQENYLIGEGPDLLKIVARGIGSTALTREESAHA
jgi:hypothetical protein